MKPENPNAFPHLEPRDPRFSYCETGMSLRDWFAGQALAMVKTPNINEHAHEIATVAYVLDDAMLAARSNDPAPVERVSHG
jgi:hypothetical protein